MMTQIKSPHLKIRISPKDSKTIIGSNSILAMQDIFTYELNTINHPTNKRLKRFFDCIIASSLFILSPILVFLIKDTKGFFINIILVFLAKKTWVGYYISKNTEQLPLIKAAVLNPSDLFKESGLSSEQLMDINLKYAQDYHLLTDLSIIFKAYKRLGKQ